MSKLKALLFTALLACVTNQHALNRAQYITHDFELEDCAIGDGSSTTSIFKNTYEMFSEGNGSAETFFGIHFSMSVALVEGNASTPKYIKTIHCDEYLTGPHAGTLNNLYWTEEIVDGKAALIAVEERDLQILKIYIAENRDKALNK